MVHGSKFDCYAHKNRYVYRTYVVPVRYDGVSLGLETNNMNTERSARH